MCYTVVSGKTSTPSELWALDNMQQDISKVTEDDMVVFDTMRYRTDGIEKSAYTRRMINRQWI